jgi:hypothetical protein
VKVAPWLHGGSLRAPTPPSWTPSTGVEMLGCTRAPGTTVFAKVGDEKMASSCTRRLPTPSSAAWSKVVKRTSGCTPAVYAVLPGVVQGGEEDARVHTGRVRRPPRRGPRW